MTDTIFPSMRVTSSVTYDPLTLGVRVYSLGSPNAVKLQLRGRAGKQYRVTHIELTPDQALDIADALMQAAGLEPNALQPTAKVDRLAIVYMDKDGALTHRIIQPLSVAGSNLKAWCEARQEFRSFNLSRILSTLEVTGEPSSLPPPPVPDHVFGD